MKERPILFSAPMVRALLAGTKTQTRRAIKAPESVTAFWHFDADRWDRMQGAVRGDSVRCPYGQPGDRLWVRETWRIGAWNDDEGTVCLDYCDGPRKEWLTVPGDDGEAFNWLWMQSTDEAIRAFGHQDRYEWEPGQSPCRWRPSIHMPRWASRITLEVTGVRVERLQDISEADAAAEGCEPVEVPVCCGMPVVGAEYMGQQEMICCGNAEREYDYRAGYRDLWEQINGPGSWDSNPWVWVVEFRRLP